MFARALKESKNTVSDQERSINKKGGLALPPLNIIRDKGLQVIC